jgi:aspartate aminotransferase
MALADRVKSIKPSPTLAVDAKAKAMKAEGIDVVGFGAGEPDFNTPENIKQAAIKAINDNYTRYLPVPGTDELKDAIINKLKTDNGIVYERPEVIVSTGAKHSLYNIAQALYGPGDEIIIPAPFWVSYPDQVLLNDATPVIVQTKLEDGFVLTPAAFKAAITPKTKALILNSPSNPTGMGYDRAALTAIAAIAVEHGIYVISDEIYEKIVYDGFKHVSIASLGPDIKALTLTVNGLSKSHAMTGWRMGYAAGPKDVIGAMSKIQSQSTSNTCSIVQKASVEALTGPQDFIGVMVAEFDKRRKYILERLLAIPGLECPTPQGAFYVFPKVSTYYGRSFGGKKIANSADISAYLLDEAKVAVVSGDAFGADEYIRLSYATSMSVIEKGLDRIEKAFAALS